MKHAKGTDVSESDNEFTDDDIMDYMSQWVDSERWSDFNIMHERGYDLLCMNHLIGAGVIEPENSFNPAIEHEIVSIYEKNWDESKREKWLDECFDGITIYICDSCGVHEFLDHVAHCTSETEIMEMGCQCKGAYQKDAYWKDGKYNQFKKGVTNE